MIHYKDLDIRTHLLDANFGLEKESLRILEDGTMAKTVHPLDEDKFIVRDFCENQTEINTPVFNSAAKAVESMYSLEKKLQKALSQRSPKEYLWPFSNPPYLKNEEDIPIARFETVNQEKNLYRNYLAAKYGRYKMTLSGIHINISFAESLLKANYKYFPNQEYQDYVNDLYLDLAQKAAKWGWIMTILTAASPILDCSYWEKGSFGRSEYMGMASVRASELGYWNFFAPIFDYTNLKAYIGSIENYLKDGYLLSASELYYPIRLKPKGEYSLENFSRGISHIELRMIDVNPLSKYGLKVEDVEFAHLFLVWLACQPKESMSITEQIQAVQNFKNAAHFDLKTVRIVSEKGKSVTLLDEAKRIVKNMIDFYKEIDADVLSTLYYQYQKLETTNLRYAWKLKDLQQEGFVEKGIHLAKMKQDLALLEDLTGEKS